MVYCKDLIFVHLPHTGGTFVGAFLEKIRKDFIRNEGHVPIEKLDSKFKNVFKFGTIRNPWSWYVSFFHYTILNKDSNYKNMILRFGEENFINFMKYVFSSLTNGDKGLYSNDFSYYFCNRGSLNNIAVNYFCRLEELKDQLAFMFDAYITRLNNKEMEILMDMNKLREGGYKDFRKFYTSEWIERVGKADKKLIDYFGYKYE